MLQKEINKYICSQLKMDLPVSHQISSALQRLYLEEPKASQLLHLVGTHLPTLVALLQFRLLQLQ